ncbi:MAG: dihydroorotate dehydrogenase electron transfer subunit [Ezakiella sp.]|nr:dihydroorotate dehydrogenase electron transfer subunit [Ezakiella sp.]MDD7471487.1 dihydroorotate dehydrogenase electron transfer subunit [Bacillota bacterium]MDY3923689.1 dihydroorotate dehydrogenase electron transfer subunit [Ezakiella sp.]
MSGYSVHKILEMKPLNDEVFVMCVEAESNGAPGQFYMLREPDTTDPMMGRPISISDVDGNKIYFLIQIMGEGTKLLSKKRAGDEILLMGPLGNGFTLVEGKTAMLAGTAGIAPFLYLSKQLKQKPDLYVGYRSGSYYTEEFKDTTENIYIATEDGSVGHKGYALDILDIDKYDTIYVCGPMPMVKATLKKFPDANTQVSLEAYMGCGFGACMSCLCDTIKGRKGICKVGPVFNGKELIFNE